MSTKPAAGQSASSHAACPFWNLWPWSAPLSKRHQFWPCRRWRERPASTSRLISRLPGSLHETDCRISISSRRRTMTMTLAAAAALLALSGAAFAASVCCGDLAACCAAMLECCFGSAANHLKGNAGREAGVFLRQGAAGARPFARPFGKGDVRPERISGRCIGGEHLCRAVSADQKHIIGFALVLRAHAG